MSEYRKDPITGRWVIIARHRAQRPRQLSASIHPSRDDPCPFCSGNEAMTPPEVWASRMPNTVADTPGWSVRVVSNKFPALDRESTWQECNDSIHETRPGLGAHEVIIESPDHVVNLGNLDDDRLIDVLTAYRARLRAYRQDRRWHYLLIYKNQGDPAGATLEHVHSQLIALTDVPREASDEIAGAKGHYAATGRCIYCECIEREIALGQRVVLNHDSFVALCPFAPRFAYETWILPKTHGAVFEQISEQENGKFACALSEAIARVNRGLGNPPFNYFIHSLPADEPAADHYHWHLEILPQLSRAAGFEWGTGSHINPVAPEDAAKLLRDVVL
jgi:UDPglucose--hexose-1-phosphate uridylyltransferase